MKEFEEIIDSFSPVTQAIIAFCMGLFAHLDVIASVIAMVVLLFQLKVVYYNGKLKKIEYDKECK